MYTVNRNDHEGGRSGNHNTKMNIDNIWLKLQSIPVLTVWAVAHADIDRWLQTGTYFVAFVTSVIFAVKTYEQLVATRDKRLWENEQRRDAKRNDNA